MTHHDHQHRQRGSMDWDEGDERGPGVMLATSGGLAAEAPGFRTEETYGGWASGEGQGEFARDGYSAQGQFSNQRVAQYGDQGYGQDYGRQGIGWQNRQDDDNQAFGQGMAGSRAHQESGNFAANGSSGVGRVRTAPIRAVLDRVPCARMKATATKGATGTKVLAATGVKAPVAVKALVGAAPGGRSNPETGVATGPGLRPWPELGRQRRRNGLLGCRKLDGRATQWPRPTGLSAQRRPDRGGCLRASDPSRHA